MNATVEMFRNSTEPGGRDLFACSVAEWLLFQQLGRDFGWMPLGTTYAAPNASKVVVTPILHGYTAGNTADPKVVEASDAVNWARALEDRRRSLESTSANAQTAGGDVGSDLIDEFIEYAYGGAFNFVSGGGDR